MYTTIRLFDQLSFSASRSDGRVDGVARHLVTRFS